VATAKKQQAPQPVAAVPKKLTRKEKSIRNKARLREVQADAFQKVRDHRAAFVADIQRKDKNVSKSLRIVKHTGKVGRPEVEIPYSDDLDRQLFKLLSVGTSLDTISTLKDMPDLSAMLTWLADETHKFNSTYTRARKLVIPLYEDRALDLALNPKIGVVKTKRQALTKDGEVVTLEEERTDDAVERARLGVQAYQWALGWMVPKKHGKQPDVNPNGKNEQLESLFAALKSGPVV
jgi:hypothetical protein